MNVFSLFSGIGGLELGLERAGMTVVGQVEIDPYCQRVLAKHWPEVPRHDDVRTCVEWWRTEPRPTVDLACGGFPCQPVSQAGKQLAQADPRWLWPAFADVVRALRPRYVLVENVPGLLVPWRDDDGQWHPSPVEEVLGDLADLGYDAEWDCVAAAHFNAPHLRRRVFVVAYPISDGIRHQPIAEPWRFDAPVAVTDGAAGSVVDPNGAGELQQGWTLFKGRGRAGDSGEPLANADSTAGYSSRPAGETIPRSETVERSGRCSGDVADPDRRTPIWTSIPRPERDPWAFEPDVGRVAHGIPARLDRLRALGNAVVPQVAEHIGRLILNADRKAGAA